MFRALAPLAGLALASCDRGPEPGGLAGWNVLLITVDTLRADHLGFSGYEDAETPVLDGLADDVTINASGGALAANPLMCAGLARLGEAYRQISSGKGQRGVAHATSGPCLQQNLVCVLEGNA